MSSQHGVQQPARWRVVLAWAVVALLAVLAVVLLVPRFTGGESVAVTPTSTPTVVTPTPTPTPMPSATAMATPTPVPTEARTETVLFEGGPARGPWQQLGTVAEITHPGAPQSASYSWRTFWSDPEEENQPDELWDQLVIEVTDQLVELGEPVDRPLSGASVGSEPFNSFGGIQDVYRESRNFTAQWSAAVARSSGVEEAYFWFLVGFDGSVQQRSPVSFLAEESPGGQDNVTTNLMAMRAWADGHGAAGCVTC